MNRDKRAAMAQETLQILQQGGYCTGGGQYADIGRVSAAVAVVGPVRT